MSYRFGLSRRHPSLAARAVSYQLALFNAALLLSCGSRSEALDTTRDTHGASADTRADDGEDTSRASAGSGAQDDTAANDGDVTGETVARDAEGNDTQAADSETNSAGGGDTPGAEDGAGANEGADAEASAAARANDDRIAELEQRPGLDPTQLDARLPMCSAPMMAELGYPTYGTEAVRLHWKPTTGECVFTSGDGTPDGWSPILTFRRRDGDTFLSTLGNWRYLAPSDLELDDLPEGRTLTFYPYLDEWQFVVDLRYDGQQVTIERFQYIEGSPPDDYGVPDRTSNDPVPDSMLVPCSSLREDDAPAEAPLAPRSGATP